MMGQTPALIAYGSPELAAEPARFRTALGLAEDRYAARFPSTPLRAAFIGT